MLGCDDLGGYYHGKLADAAEEMARSRGEWPDGTPYEDTEGQGGR